MIKTDECSQARSWKIFDSGIMRPSEDEKRCLAAKSNDFYDQVQRFARIEYDGVLNDSRVMPQKVIEDHSGMGWLGDPEHKTAYMILYFDRSYFVDVIKIFWKFVPKTFEV